MQRANDEWKRNRQEKLPARQEPPYLATDQRTATGCRTIPRRAEISRARAEVFTTQKPEKQNPPKRLVLQQYYVLSGEAGNEGVWQR